MKNFIIPPSLPHVEAANNAVIGALYHNVEWGFSLDYDETLIYLRESENKKGEKLYCFLSSRGLKLLPGSWRLEEVVRLK